MDGISGGSSTVKYDQKMPEGSMEIKQAQGPNIAETLKNKEAEKNQANPGAFGKTKDRTDEISMNGKILSDILKESPVSKDNVKAVLGFDQ